jgi:tetratricopeptide (TPR) repeat protein
MEESKTPAASGETSVPAATNGSGVRPFCTACGTRNPADANFCKQCGHRLEKTTHPALSEADMALPPDIGERVNDLLLIAYQKSEKGDHEGAIATTAEALRLKPDSTDAHSLMSTLYERRGDISLAIAERERVLLLNPGSSADREKLDQLRAEAGLHKTIKVNSVRPVTRPVLFDSPATAGIVAMGVLLVVMLVGGILLFMKSGEQDTVSSAAGVPVPPISRSADTVVQAPNTQQPNNTLQQPSAGRSNIVMGLNGGMAPGSMDALRRNAFAQPGRQPGIPSGFESGGGVPPVVVNPGASQPLEMSSRPQPRPGSNTNGTFILPENENSTQGGGANPSAQNPPAQPANTGAGGAAQQPPSRPNPGKIEIIVANGPNDTPKPPAGSPNTPANTAAGESRARRAIAQENQVQGNYRRALAEYYKALDGAGDDAPAIHQQIAVCHQRLDDRESAVKHYTEAINGFKALIAAGKQVDASNAAIKACELGIKANR